jgi:predicted lipase
MVLALTLLCALPTLSANELESINFTEIQKQATFANAAYQSEGTVRALVESGNYTLTLYHTIPDTQISFFLATNELTKTQIISVRGTSNVENAMVDISLKLMVDKNTGVRLHEGFSFAAKQVYAELEPLLNSDYKINVTGHSLGGAVALILAMYLDAYQFNIEQVITFGQPKVTNISGANKIQHINVIRVVTPFDLVPLVPLFDPLDISNLDVYWHAGKEVILLADTQYAILEGTDSMLRATRFTQKPLTEDNLSNHQMPIYLEMIKAKTKSSKLVPYQTDLNLFNLFGSD